MSYSTYNPRYQNQGSALAKVMRGNPRSEPCPTCKQLNGLTPSDARKGYQCNQCARSEEGAF